ncbi:MAG: D-alanine-D-alanine ligase-like protein [Candidatus Roizmanbacteria bacterium GW2011_GWA2_36_23]|uniref:D-alanine-D-alanine ligase-like protein n=1 Tax=Candidatus Roizmanbacteria bacterium GW2011_GWA2_36_23 TaxID=1618480 RepID=A0A0G0GPS7_9BACT|nr:MAG: D-alanine-D-alanine ligase-like protein [Candidatus Roizmanbacteria bacterium GW2011_GWA2_36_23]
MKIHDAEKLSNGEFRLRSDTISKLEENSDLENKNLLIVNTGFIKKRFIFQKLKKLGIKVILLNKEKNWAQPYVDHWIIADTTNHRESISAIENFIQTNRNISLEGAITFWEDDVLLTSKITDKFNFIGIPYHIAKKIRNKYLFREFCLDNGIPSPSHTLIKNSNDLKIVEENFKFPVVVKPAYGSESSFVVRIDDPDELLQIYSYVKRSISSNVQSALNDGLDIFVEEYIDGDEVDIDLLVQNGKIKFYSLSDNFNKSKDIFFMDSGQQIPSSLPARDQDQIMEMVEETLEKLGIQNGCIHFEAKSTRHGPMPLEINLRMGGDYVHSYIKDAWNIDLIESSVKIAVGQYIKPKKNEAPKKYIIGWDLYPEDSGILVQLDISEKLKRKRYLEELHIYKKIGEPVLVQPDGTEYLGWLTISGESPIDAQDNLQNALDYIDFKVVKFDPASSLGKTSRKHRYTFASLHKDTLMRAVKIEQIRRMSTQHLRKLHIGIVCNIYDGEEGSVEQDLMSVGKNIEKTLVVRGYKVSFFDFNNLPKVFNDLRNSDVDIVFNVCERINNSSLLEPHAASILDTLQVPYTGSNPFTLALCIDKIRVKKLLTFHDIPTPKWDYAYSMDDEIDEDMKFPLIVKPGNTDNSIGITNESVVVNKRQLKKQLEKIILKLGRPALVEEYIEGDEYDVSIIGSDETDLKILPLSRSIFDKMPKGYWHIYPFDAKWADHTVYKKIVIQRPAKINKRLESLISEIALDTYNILDCHDYGRVEIRVDKNDNPYVLELNPNPSININDCVPACAELIGMDYGDFLEDIIRMAIRRYKNKPPYYHLQANLM